MPRSLIIIPALNEAEALPGTLRDLRRHAPEFDVLVVDDGSTDGTSEVARAHGAHVVSHPFNLGVGGALRTGFKFAHRAGFRRAYQFDADGQHCAECLPDLERELDRGTDLVIGSRFTGTGPERFSMSPIRKLAVRIMRTCLRAALGYRLTDPSSGFRGFGPAAIELFHREYPRDYLSDTAEAILRAGHRGLRVTEVPVTMRPRQGGRPSARHILLAYHYIRFFVVLISSASMRGRRAARKAMP